MPLVNVMVNSRAYTIACDEGEEPHLKKLAAHVDGKVRELLESVGQVGDSRLMLMAALLLADESTEAQSQVERLEQQLNSSGDPASRPGVIEGLAAEKLESATRKLEDIAARFSQA